MTSGDCGDCHGEKEEVEQPGWSQGDGMTILTSQEPLPTTAGAARSLTEVQQHLKYQLGPTATSLDRQLGWPSHANLKVICA